MVKKIFFLFMLIIISSSLFSIEYSEIHYRNGFKVYRYYYKIKGIDNYYKNGSTVYIRDVDNNNSVVEYLTLHDTNAWPHSLLKFGWDGNDTQVYRWKTYFPFIWLSKWELQDTYTHIVIPDNSPPLISFSNLSPLSNANGWHKDNVTVSSIASDSGSKLQTTASKSTLVTSEGKITVTHTATDNVGNVGSGIKIVYIDRTDPRPVDANIYSGPIISNDGDLISFNWADAQDLAPETNPNIDTSGVQEYEFITTENGNITYTHYPTESIETCDLSGFTRDLIYTPQVQVFDKAGNDSPITVFDSFSIPLQSSITAFEYGEPQYKDGVVAYPIKMEVQFSRRSLDPDYAIKGLKLFAIEDTPDGTDPIEIMLKDDFYIPEFRDGDILPDGLIPRGGNYYYTYHLQLESKDYAHKPYEYVLETVHQFNFENGLPFTEKSEVHTPRDNTPEAKFIEVRNLEIPQELYFDIFRNTDSSPELIATINSSGNEVVFNTEINKYEETGLFQFYTNTHDVFISVKNVLGVLSEQIDPEGDLITFNIDSSTLESGLISSSEFEDYGQVVILKQNDNSTPIPGTEDITGEDIETFRITLVDRVGDEEFPYNDTEVELHLQMDDSIDGNFTPILTHMEENEYLPTEALGDEHPVNRIDNLKLIIDGVYDSQSGIKSVEAFPISYSDFLESGLDVDDEIDNNEIYPNIISGPVNIKELLYVETNAEDRMKYEIDDFVLDSESSIKKYIIIRVTDNAGNEDFKHLVIAYDPTPPGLPEIKYVHNDGFINITADYPETEVSGGYQYLWQNDLIIGDAADKANNVDVDTTGLGFNDLQDIPLVIIDKAGNYIEYPAQFCTYGDLTEAQLTDLADELEKFDAYIREQILIPLIADIHFDHRTYWLFQFLFYRKGYLR